MSPSSVWDSSPLPKAAAIAETLWLVSTSVQSSESPPISNANSMPIRPLSRSRPPSIRPTVSKRMLMMCCLTSAGTSSYSKLTKYSATMSASSLFSSMICPPFIPDGSRLLRFAARAARLVYCFDLWDCLLHQRAVCAPAIACCGDRLLLRRQGRACGHFETLNAFCQIIGQDACQQIKQPQTGFLPILLAISRTECCS